ncbi:MAG: UDP-N-acetylglucosamine--N-acetylmuramyl-(pentapeptide) pyrophosphoryl-undecaprenol N-acetylglucosamine transferase [Chloroflexi bacterium]|nr:UDP-N-acetylglucosamine--N-acetylmuramyl-(pentapeptide) pyrophosphoryl-undecaprenol N-acetylglucosamine transferase [Chloroflexota bacterium]
MADSEWQIVDSHRPSAIGYRLFGQESFAMRVALCGGGTGGHVYPLLAVRSALSALEHDSPDGVEWLFIGGRGIEQSLVQRESVPYRAISGGGLHGVGLLKAIPNVARLSLGVAQAGRALASFKPHVLLATGGFITIPVVLAAAARRTPLVVYLPDIEPALSVRFIGRFAARVTATAEASQAYFRPRQFVETGYPVRQGLAEQAKLGPSAARARFGIPEGRPTVLVIGGSRGARSLNRAVIARVADLLRQANLIHISGSGEWAEVQAARAALPEDLQAHYHAFPYLHEEMGAAFAAADLVVSRSGASTLGEFPLFGLPSILVPYPHAWRYQKVNADYLARRGAAVVVRDEALLDELHPTMLNLLGDEVSLNHMRQSARALARPAAAQAIAEAVIQTVRRHS